MKKVAYAVLGAQSLMRARSHRAGKPVSYSSRVVGRLVSARADCAGEQRPRVRGCV
jgi:hypothetical protein